MLLSIKLLLGKLNTMQFIANVPCPVGVLPFLMAGFQESLVFGQGEDLQVILAELFRSNL